MSICYTKKMTKRRKTHKKLRRWLKKNRVWLLLCVAAAVIGGGVYVALYHREWLPQTHPGSIGPAETPLAGQNGELPAWMPDTVKRWRGEITRQAQQYNISPQLVAIIMTLESGGDPKAHSGVASGLMQVTDSTGKEIAAKIVKPARTNYDLFDPETSIAFGAAYLAHLRDQLCVPLGNLSENECVELIAAGYNGGLGAAGNLYHGRGLEAIETLSYSRDAMNLWRERVNGSSPTFSRWFERGGHKLVEKAQEYKK